VTVGAVAAPAPLLCPDSAASAILSWVASVGAGDPQERFSQLPQARTVLGAPEGGAGLRVLGVAGLPLPQTAELASCGVVFEGTLHETAELRAELGLESAPPLTDAELVVRAYLEWGEEMPARLKGLFALVLWDGRQQSLLAARDRMGIYPLFETETGTGEHLFATSPDLLGLHPRVSRRLHREVLAERLVGRYFDARESSYAEIRRVLPGHQLLVRGDREAEHRRFWNPIANERLTDSPTELGERYDELLARAVARCLEAGAPGIFLSGGLDSVNIAAVVADQCATGGVSRPLALSLRFPGEISEERTQRYVSGALGLELVLVDFEEAAGGVRALEEVTRLSAEFPAPLESVWKVAYLRLAAEGARRNCRAILTGAGGDEWLDVGIHVAADLMREFEIRELAELWVTMRRAYRAPTWLLLRNLLWKYGARPLVAAAATKVLGPLAEPAIRARKRRFARETTPEWLAPDPALRRSLDERAERYLPDPPTGRHLATAALAGLDHPLTVLGFEEQFESGRRSGVPIFSPFNDADLVEFLCRVPRSVLQQGRRTKGLLRERAVRRFPEGGFDRQKKLASPNYFRAVVHGQSGAVWDALGGARTLSGLGVVDAVKLNGWIRGRLAEPATRLMAFIWYALSVESWTRARS
jgi:asparagine synthase (glutamine-hydrolysing)